MKSLEKNSIQWFRWCSLWLQFRMLLECNDGVIQTCGLSACPTPCMTSNSTCHPWRIRDHKLWRSAIVNLSSGFIQRYMGRSVFNFHDFVKTTMFLSNIHSTYQALWAVDNLTTLSTCTLYEASHSAARCTVNPTPTWLTLEALAKTKGGAATRFCVHPDSPKQISMIPTSKLCQHPPSRNTRHLLTPTPISTS